MSFQQAFWVFVGFSGRLSRQAFAFAGVLPYVIRFYPVCSRRERTTMMETPLAQ